MLKKKEKFSPISWTHFVLQGYFCRLFRGGKYSEEDAKVIIVQILSAVSFCHLQGVAHRDLKPEVIYFINMITAIMLVMHYDLKMNQLSVLCFFRFLIYHCMCKVDFPPFFTRFSLLTLCTFTQPTEEPCSYLYLAN